MILRKENVCFSLQLAADRWSLKSGIWCLTQACPQQVEVSQVAQSATKLNLIGQMPLGETRSEAMQTVTCSSHQAHLP